MLKHRSSSDILFNKDNNKAVLLIHCFRCSPIIFEELTGILFDNGFSVYNLRLPGHGFKNEEEIFNVKLRDWELMCENTYLDLADRFKEIYLAGISLGAGLIINLVIKYNNIKKIVLYSPMIKLRQRWAFTAGVIKYFKKKMPPSEIDVSVNKDFENELLSFFPVPQGYEAYKLTKKLQKNINKAKTDTLCFLSKNDHDINYYDNYKIIKEKTSFKIISLEKSFHLNIIDIEKDYIFKKTLQWFKNILI